MGLGYFSFANRDQKLKAKLTVSQVCSQCKLKYAQEERINCKHEFIMTTINLFVGVVPLIYYLTWNQRFNPIWIIISIVGWLIVLIFNRHYSQIWKIRTIRYLTDCKHQTIDILN
jgi:hypothetical protein